MSVDELAAAVGGAAAHELGSALSRLTHCVNQLTDDQLWWRAHTSSNSIGNLILHLCGNLRQWVVAGLGGTSDLRDRPAEFTERGPIPRGELLRRLEAVVSEAQEVLNRQTAANLLAIRCIQSYDVTGLAALFDSVPHFRGHTQEIVGMTRQLLGDAYQFQWQPKTKEEGAPA